jgi:LysM repeat protein
MRMDSLNLVDMIKGYFTGGIVNRFSTLLGESNQRTEMGINAAIPGLLARFSNTASTADGATRLASAVDNADDGILSNISSMFGKNTYSASSSLRSVLGDGGISDLTGSIGKAAGLSGSTVTTLLGFVAPVVLGVLRRLKRSQGLDASGLANLLFGQRDNIAAAMPESMRIQTDTGIREPLREVRQGSYQTAPTAPRATETYATAGREHHPRSFSWILPFALLALFGWLLWHWASRRPVRAGSESGQVAEERQPQQERMGAYALQDALIRKYSSAIQAAQQQGVQISAMTLQDRKLLIQGSAPSVEAANRFSNEIRKMNPKMDDIVVDLKINEAQSPAAKSTEAEPKTSEQAVTREKPAATEMTPESGVQTYIVKRGDTLGKISKHFYGDTSGATRIFVLNKNRLKNPNSLIVGQKLEIPAK